FLNDPSTTQIYPLSLHDALPIFHKSRATGRWKPTPRSILPAADKSANPARAHRAERLRRSLPIGTARTHSPASSRASTCRRHSRSEEHTSELQSLAYLVCRLLLE